MTETIVRLSSLEISNIKNVQGGKIVLPHALKREKTSEKADVLGIYGQNGSGKTAIIDTLFFLQQIMSGKSLSKEFADYIDVTKPQAQILAVFHIYSASAFYEVEYLIELERQNQGVLIKRESIRLSKEMESGKSGKATFIEYKREDKDNVFTPRKKFDEVAANDRENKTDLIVARKMAEKSNCSYIFGESSREIFGQDFKNSFYDGAIVVGALYSFAKKDLFVIRNTHSGVISANFLLPMAFRKEEREVSLKGDFAIPMMEPMVLLEEQKEILEWIMEQINTVLYTIIPGMQIGVKDYGKQMTDSGEMGYKVELLSMRPNIPPIPIRMESEGIIKMISILNVWIHAFGNPSVCLAVDELDAGIFEYMLGELLEIFRKSAKGQLIFTSHNLRPLEMLDKECIMFSTANPSKRYIRIKTMKSSKNLRDVYLRGITLGGHEEVIYEETDSLKMARAFRKAGRAIRHE